MNEDAVVGTLYEHLTGVALRIRQRVDAHAMLVWVDELGTVYAQRPTEAPDVATSSTIGTFSSATTVDNIEVDLRAALRERARDWIVE